MSPKENEKSQANVIWSGHGQQREEAHVKQVRRAENILKNQW